MPLLSRFTELDDLWLDGTLTTPQGFGTLRTALPDTRIVGDR